MKDKRVSLVLKNMCTSFSKEIMRLWETMVRVSAGANAITCPYPANFAPAIIIRMWKRRYIYIGHVWRLWTLFPVLNETLRYAIAIIVGCGFPYDTRRCDGQDSYVIRFLMSWIPTQIRGLRRVRTAKTHKGITATKRYNQQESQILLNEKDDACKQIHAVLL